MYVYIYMCIYIYIYVYMLRPPKAACEKGDEYVVSLLVRARADPSMGDAAGLTAFDLLRRRHLPDSQIAQLLSPPAGVGGTDGPSASA